MTINLYLIVWFSFIFKRCLNEPIQKNKDNETHCMHGVHHWHESAKGG